jgi:hypothetical protein
MKSIIITLNIVILLFGNAFSNIENPLSQWTDIILVRKSEDGIRCLFLKSSRLNEEEEKLLLNNVKKWAVSDIDKSWIYALKVSPDNDIELSQSKVIPEIDANVMQKILEDLSHKFDLDKIRAKVNKERG